MNVRKKAAGLLAAASLAAGVLLGTAGVSAAGERGATVASPATAATAAYGKTYLNTVVNQWSHWTPDARDSSHAGWLYKASNYFYCWTNGATYTGNGHTSDVWLRTDDDSGNVNVYVTDVYLDSWGSLNDTKVLPHC